MNIVLVTYGPMGGEECQPFTIDMPQGQELPAREQWGTQTHCPVTFQAPDWVVGDTFMYGGTLYRVLRFKYDIDDGIANMRGPNRGVSPLRQAVCPTKTMYIA